MNALTPTQISDAPLPAVYEQAKSILAECATIDECRDWSDRAAALASYAKQANDETLEQKARMIRNRAIRQMGKVLEAIEPVNAARDRKDGADLPLSRKQAARDAGISERQQKTALRVASLPEDEFEAATKAVDRQPTVTQLAEKGTKKRVVVDHTGGRDPDIFNRCMHFVANLQRAASEVTKNSTQRLPGVSNLELLPHLTADELADAQSAAEILREFSETIEAFQ